MKYLYVAASPEVSLEDHRMVSDRLAGEFGLPVREMEIPAVDFAYDAGRRQYGSIAVLEMLLRLRPPDAGKLLAVTDRDLFVPVLTFVFGQAQLGGRAAVVSLARLRQEFYGLAAQPRSVRRARRQGGAARNRPSVRAGALRGPELRHVAGHQHPADRYQAGRLLRSLRGAAEARTKGVRA